MTPRADPVHQRVWEALPWVANGRAAPEQAAMVVAHVAHCDDCRAELELQQHLCHSLCLPAEQAPAGDPHVELGLQRLLARLDDIPEQAPPLAPMPPLTAPPGIVADAGPRRLTMALAAAVMLQAVGLGLLSLRLWPAEPPGDYRTLSTADRATPPAATLRVLPDAAMTLAEWNTLLRAQGLQIVAGPNAAGAFALAPAPGAAATPRTAALAQLRAQPGIRLAEPIGDAP
jgi:hypothetical protein